MIGQKRRQSPAVTDRTGERRSRTLSADDDSSSLDDTNGVSIFRYLSRAMWFRSKLSKTKSSRRDNVGGIDGASAESASRTDRESSASSSSSTNSDFFERQRHRCRRFCKRIIKRSRTTEDHDRRTHEQIGDDYALATEEDWKRLESSIARLLDRLHDQHDEGPAFPDEECVICVTGRASMQTFPCGHKVLCKTCFVRTIQVALQERQLPLRCIVCRSRVVRLKQQPATCRVVVRQQPDPPGSYYLPPAPSPSPPSGIRRPGYM